jgi:signal transduction histidine kinase
MTSLGRTYPLEVAISLLALAGIVELVVRRHASDAPHSSLWFCIPATAALAAPLLVRRRFPFVALAAFWALAAGIAFVDGRLIPFVSGVFVIGALVSFMLGTQREEWKARTGLAVVLAGAAIVVYNNPRQPAIEFVFIPVLFGLFWSAGFVVRERAGRAEAAQLRASQAEQERDAATRIAVAEERARIARELHDIVAHAVSVMVLQVGAVRHRLPDSVAEDREALRGVEQAGRAALSEMRRLLAVMRRDGDSDELAPQPGLDRLDSLVSDIGRAGLPVEVHLDGEPFPLPRGIDLSAYRIVQEGLTNALKHAGAQHADVTVQYAPDEVRIEVRDDGRGALAGDGLGHGLIGIRERVKLYGGEMTTGTANGGGFLLSTRLPITQYRR